MNNGLYLLFSINNSLAVSKRNLVSFPWENGTLHFCAPSYFTDSKNNLIIYINGQVFSDNPDSFQFIKNQYLKHGIDFVQDLKGSFLLIIIDNSKNTFFIATDKLHSKKVFIQETAEFLLVTDSLFSQSIKEISIDESSLAQYLTSGFVFNSRTLINGINLSKPSTCYSFIGSKLHEKKYWEISFSSELKNKGKEELEKELFSLLQNAIKRRVNNDDALLSLSGGYDATCLLLLLNEFSVTKPSCFTYYSGTLTPFSDAWVANKQACLLNNKIEFILAYNDDFENFIIENAINGQGISNISFETNAWDYIKNHNPQNQYLPEKSFLVCAMKKPIILMKY